ncbi:MAG: hypothetical protein Q8Q42_04240 [Nanoarchaeota archaeon]|nr:hypothetical protein [Nanoarchaeota archaeon]
MKYILGVTVLGFLIGLFIGGLAETTADYTPDRMSAGNHVANDEIKLLGNNVFINLDGKKLIWSEFENTNSMIPVFDKGHNGLEFVPDHPDEIKVGDIISFEYNNEVIIHRVVDIGYDDSGIYYITKGDNALEKDSGKRRFGDVHGVMFGVIF